jgi:glucokinase
VSTGRQNSGTSLLAGDIGGTKTNVALFDASADARAAQQARTFKNEDFANFEALLDTYLSEHDAQVAGLCVGVAGPVSRGRVELTNLDWTLDAEALQTHLGGGQAWLLNDLEATAQAVPLMEAQELHTLQAGDPEPGGDLAVIAPGTGLGESFLTWNGEEPHAHAGEGGHTDFAPRTPLQDELLIYLRQHFDHVSYERVCSGIGLPHIYHFLRDSGRGEEPEWLAKEVVEAEDATPVIVGAALGKEPVALASQALEIFVEVLAAEAGNLALKVGATGGVYIGGGIPPRILPLLDQGRFIEAFVDKGRHRDYLERMPVHVLLNSGAALLGAADFGLRALRASNA